MCVKVNFDNIVYLHIISIIRISDSGFCYQFQWTARPVGSPTVWDSV